VNSQVITTVVQTVLGGGFLGAVFLYVKERRVNKAKGDVAVGTVDVQIDRDRLGLLEGRLNLLNKTFDAESAAKDATIAHLRADLEAERAENAVKDAELTQMRRELEVMRHEADDMRGKLKAMSDRVDEMLRPTTDPRE
jgi:uncharacterized protein YeeX (DUF496 family)